MLKLPSPNFGPCWAVNVYQLHRGREGSVLKVRVRKQNRPSPTADVGGSITSTSNSSDAHCYYNRVASLSTYREVGTF